MIDIVAPILFMLAVAVVIILAAYFGYAHLSGELDAEYPSIAKGDYRTGLGRKVYLIGLRRGIKNLARDKRRRALTLERRAIK